MKIGVSGCSHSSYIAGNPWHHYMGKKFNACIIESWSKGAGNEMNVEKIKYILDNNSDMDLFVLQLTDPSRMVMGITNFYNMDEMSHEINDRLDNHRTFMNSHYYTFNAYHNDNNLTKILKKDIYIDDFMINHVISSDYNQGYKLFHTLMGIQYLCDSYNVKAVFFSWFVDIYELSKKYGYDYIIKNMNIIKGCVNDFIKEKKIDCEIGEHYDSMSHEKIFNEYLYEDIKKLI